MGVRKCSKCGKTGHNSRTCRNVSSNCGKIMKLFGVELAKVPFPANDDDGLKLKNSSKTEMTASSSDEDSDKLKHIINGATQGQRKKGIPWSEEEHKLFLLGLEKLGKGNWRGISRNFVTSRTSTQVASHAQKYFLRRNNATKNKFTPTILSTVRRNEAQYCIYSKKNPNNPQLKLPEGPYFCRLFNNSAAHNIPPSLELSLAAPPLPAAAAVWERRPVLLWKKQYVVTDI